MSKNLRSRISFNRKRFNIRKVITLRNTIIITSVICLVVIVSSIVSAIALNQKVKRATVKYNKDDEEQIAYVNSMVDIYDNESAKENNQNEEVDNEINNETSNITINLLGEIMMGGEVSTNLEYIYSYAFKDIYNITKASDFTYANLSTNITNMDKIEDSKSKYIVTKEIISGLKVLGLDSVSIASDHMMDFSSTMYRTTIGILENSNIYIAGQKDNPVYFEKDNKKIALISTNSVIRGTKSIYENNNISMYDSSNLQKNIKEAKKSAEFVIVDIHWGRDYEYGVTDEMRQMAYDAIDSGADIVIGSHALGVYPIITYKEKPIIYSLGYLISDTDYFVGKESFIYNITVNNNFDLEKIEMTPIYINNKEQVLLYKNYDLEKARDYLEQMNNWQVENGLNSSIINDIIEVKF